MSLHVDVEPQKSYQPGYPIEKRGLYYLARSLSSQLSLVTEATDYGQLEKCYGIWICRDDIPQERSIQKLQKLFTLTKEEAEEYYNRFAANT